RSGSDTPLVLMGYLNPVVRFGVGNFFEAAASSGVDGVILPDLPPVERQRGPFPHARLDHVMNERQRPGRNHRTKGERVVTQLRRQRIAHGDLPRLGKEARADFVVGLIPHRHDGRGRHATLAGAPVAGGGHVAHHLVDPRIRHDHEVVLGPTHREVTLVLPGTTFRHRGAGTARTDDREARDIGMVDQRLGDRPVAGDQVEHPGRKAGFMQQFRDPLHGHRHLFRWFQHEGVPRGEDVGKEPEGDHCGEVERTAHREHAQGQAQDLAIDALGTSDQLVAHLQDRHPARGFDVLEGALEFRPRVPEGFPHLAGENDRQFLFAFTQACGQPEERLDTAACRGVAPTGEGPDGRRHCLGHLLRATQRTA
ncbi:MAG: tryptophan synthase subunit alpha, partial [Verrucomicrobiae bacterium]|nr:tryptophan synthase subunit alpha [Verrucomicrobiae bacterium]